MKCTLEQAMKAQRRFRGTSTLSLTSTLGGGGWSKLRSGRCTPGKDTGYLLYMRLGGPEDQCRFAGAEEPSPTEIRYPDHPARSESHAHRRVLQE